MNTSVVEVVAGVVAALVLTALWVIPVVLGVRWARCKGVSPRWMWFGVHPLTGWIAFWIIRYRVRSRLCRSCGKSVPSTAKFCPHCQVAQDQTVQRFRWFRNEVACAKCHHWVKLNTPFCPSCSAPAPRIQCPVCDSDGTTLVGGSSALVSGIFVALLAGSFFGQFEQSLGRSQVLRYTKSLARAMTLEMSIYAVGGVLLLGAAGVLLFGAWGTRLKKVSCQKCGSKSPVPAEPILAGPTTGGQ